MSDLLKGLWSKLYAWAIPSALALGAYWLLLYPKFCFPAWLDVADETTKAATFGALTVTTAFCLNALSTPLYRVLEGYLLWPEWLKRCGTDRQIQRKHKLQRDVSGTGLARNLAVEKLAYYPLDDRQIAPTRFGNALRAFESYGKSRFNLDSQTLWYEVSAVAPKYLQDQYDSARATVDFFVASVWLSAFLCIAALAGAVRQAYDPGLFVVAALAFAVMLLCRWMLVRVTRDWSLAVQAMVNLGRKKLAESLGLQIPVSLEEERHMWGHLTSFVFYGDQAHGSAVDHYRKRDEAPAARGRNAATEAGEQEKDDNLDDNDEESES